MSEKNEDRMFTGVCVAAFILLVFLCRWEISLKESSWRDRGVRDASDGINAVPPQNCYYDDYMAGYRSAATGKAGVR